MYHVNPCKSMYHKLMAADPCVARIVPKRARCKDPKIQENCTKLREVMQKEPPRVRSDLYDSLCLQHGHPRHLQKLAQRFR